MNQVLDQEHQMMIVNGILHETRMLCENLRIASGDPENVFKPSVTKEGVYWKAQYHDVIGYGKSPQAAVMDFNKVWWKEEA